MKKIHKISSQKATVVDEDNHIIEFVISDETRDRQGDVVKQDGWDFENFLNNPVVLFGHDSWSFPIGKAVSVVTDAVTKKTVAAIQFAVDEYDKAATAFNLVKGGYLNTTSVGFINKEREGNELQVNELLEISVVPVPANPNAFALAFEAGEINKSDAQWLVKNFQTSIDSLKKSIENKKEGNIMTEAQEKLLNETAEAVTALKAQQDTILENQTKMLDAVTDMKKSFTKDAAGGDAGDANGDGGAAGTGDQGAGDDAGAGDQGSGDQGDGNDGGAGDASANADNGDAGADEVTVDTEVDPDNLSEEEARAFEAELQKQLEGSAK